MKEDSVIEVLKPFLNTLRPFVPPEQRKRRKLETQRIRNQGRVKTAEEIQKNRDRSRKSYQTRWGKTRKFKADHFKMNEQSCYLDADITKEFHHICRLIDACH